MNNKVHFLILFLGIAQLMTAQHNEPTNLTANQLLDEIIQYYDPYNNWLNYKGEVHFYRILPDGTLRSEDIYLDNKKELYQSFLYQNDSIIMRKWDKNQVAYSLNGSTNLSKATRTELKLRNQDIQFIKRRHRTEIGWPMQIKALDLLLNPIIKDTIFNNKPCLMMESIGVPPASKGKYPLLEQSIFYYINPVDYSLEGMDFPLEIKSQNIPGFRVIFNQHININDIKIPQVKTYYRLKDNQYYYTTYAHAFVKQPYIDENLEKIAINKLLANETYYFRIRDFEKWQLTWSHQPDIVHCFASKNGYVRNEGWANVSSHILSIFNQFPEPENDPLIKRDNYVYYIHRNIAWVYFDSKESASHGRQQRMLRKENGQWKLISASGIDEASYKE